VETRIGELFLRETEHDRLEPSDQQLGRPQPPLQRVLASGPRVRLPKVEASTATDVPLGAAIERRRSLRDYRPGLLELEELAFLLWCTQGVKRFEPGRWTFRTVPSAGARHPFETVLLVHRVEGLSPGLYQYLALEHEIASFESPTDVTPRLVEACLGQRFVETCAVAFLWVADRYRTAWRYGERSLRYLFLDAGHVCQNLYLAAESIGAGACAIGAFDDRRVNDLLGLDGTDQFVIYLAAVGK